MRVVWVNNAFKSISLGKNVHMNINLMTVEHRTLKMMTTAENMPLYN